MQTWFIDDYAIPFLLRTNGFICIKQDLPSCYYGNNWFITDCPIPMDGDYTLADGTVIEGCSGVELRIKGRFEMEPTISLD